MAQVFFARPWAAMALCILSAAASQLACAQGTLDRIKQRGGVIIGHREASIPLSYMADGKALGYSVDVCLKLAEVLAKHVGLKSYKVDYKMLTSSNRFEAIEKGEADLECGSTTNTAERRKRVAFTIPHFISASRLMVLSSKPYERLEDLNGKTVASTAGTTSIKSLAQEARVKTLDFKIEAAKDHAEGVNWVLTGKADAFLMDDVLLFGLRANMPKPQDLKVVGKPLTIEPYAIGFERDNPVLKQLIDAELRRLISSREIYAMYDKWFLAPIPPKGINLDMRMSYLLTDSFKFPTDFVPN